MIGSVCNRGQLMFGMFAHLTSTSNITVMLIINELFNLNIGHQYFHDN